MTLAYSERPERLLSYSSLMTLMGCQQKYVHHKILKTKPDSDHREGDALTIGKCFHQVLEDTLHTNLDLDRNLKLSMKDYPLKDDWNLRVKAMLIAYTKMHALSGLEVRAVEIEVLEDNFVAYIDAIMTGPNGEWWIVDLKTAARWDKNLMKTLPYDFQLSLYSMRYQKIAKDLSLDPKKFMGCRYRATTKPSLFKQRAGETDGAFVMRMAERITSTDVVVKLEELKKFWGRVNEMSTNYTNMAIKLKEGATPAPNYGECFKYFKPCRFWSQCHEGVIYSDKSNVEYFDTNTYKNLTEAKELL